MAGQVLHAQRGMECGRSAQTLGLCRPSAYVLAILSIAALRASRGGLQELRFQPGVGLCQQVRRTVREGGQYADEQYPALSEIAAREYQSPVPRIEIIHHLRAT